MQAGSATSNPPNPSPQAAPNPATQKALAQYKAEQDAAGGPIAWQQLAAFLAEQLGPFRASDEVRGRTQELGSGVKASLAARNYKAGESSMRVAIGEKYLNAMALVSLEHGKEFERKNADGFTRLTKIGGYAELLIWQSSRRQSMCAVLLGLRLLEISVIGAAAPDQAEAIAKQLPLEAIANLRAAGGAGLQPGAGSTRPPP